MCARNAGWRATIKRWSNGDTTTETNETFFVNLSGNPNITDGQGIGTIRKDDTASTGPTVCQIYDTTALGSPDPSGLAYVPGKGLFLCDSGVNESPFYRTLNLFLLQPNGNQLTPVDSYNLTGFTNEPTGLTYAPSTDPNNPSQNRLYISDVDAKRVFWVGWGFTFRNNVTLHARDNKPLSCAVDEVSGGPQPAPAALRNLRPGSFQARHRALQDQVRSSPLSRCDGLHPALVRVARARTLPII